ncbi:hypothetical protein HYH02_003756 [Chlamydomonas schloesseri]|uniref:MYND-type domain-containing protein n=1 Tax=Chlamydomonas schloesseri TaxID=2026947 RepID=A0A836BA94_9CHLO|nr:hypothetical protein HYH02_003756 [Chlamydomonas schloesseri]|eukprot:KAG2451985.1 hypothetical protein HYH02_003756 [Chlamydomonas schloesseri]
MEALSNGRQQDPGTARVASTAAGGAGSGGAGQEGFILTCGKSGRDVRSCTCQHHCPDRLLDACLAAVQALQQACKVCSLRAQDLDFDVLPAAARSILSFRPAENTAAASTAAAAAGTGSQQQLQQAALPLDSDVDRTATLLHAAGLILKDLSSACTPHPSLHAALASREVRRLQALLIERLVLHGGSGGGAAGGGGGARGGGSSNSSSNSQQQWWLLRYEAESGTVVNAAYDADVGVASGPAAWADPRRQQALESTHLSWLNASLCCWVHMTPGSGCPPPPLALVLRLAARAAEALARLSSGASSGGDPGSVTTTCGDGGGGAAAGVGGPGGPGLGLGGATYGPAPRFLAAYSEGVFQAFCFSEQRRALLKSPDSSSITSFGSSSDGSPTTQQQEQQQQQRQQQQRAQQVEALLPDALEAGAWCLALQAAALQRLLPAGLAALSAELAAAESGAEGGAVTVTQPPAAVGAGCVGEVLESLCKAASTALSSSYSAWCWVPEGEQPAAAAGSLPQPPRTHPAQPQIPGRPVSGLQSRSLEVGPDCRAAAAAMARQTGLLRSLDSLLRSAAAAELALLRAFPGLGAAGVQPDSSISDSEKRARSVVSSLQSIIRLSHRSALLVQLVLRAAGAQRSGIDGNRASVAVPAPGGGPPSPAAAGGVMSAVCHVAAAAPGSASCLQTGSSPSAAIGWAAGGEEWGWVLSGTKWAGAMRRRVQGMAAAILRPAAHGDPHAPPQQAAAVAAAAAEGKDGPGSNSLGRRRSDPRALQMRDAVSTVQGFWTSRDLHRGQPQDVGSAAPYSRTALAAAEAHAYALRAGCDWGALAPWLSDVDFTSGCYSALRIEMYTQMAVTAAEWWAAAAAGRRFGPWTGAAAPPLPAAQLLACQPHRLLAAACGMLRRLKRDPLPVMKDEVSDVPDMRFKLGRALVRALAAAGSHPQLAPHLLSWLAPPLPAARQQADSGATQPAASPAAPDPQLRGCLRAPLKSALPALVVEEAGTRPGQSAANRAHAAAAAALQELAACWGGAAGGASGPGGGGGGGGGTSAQWGAMALPAVARRTPASEWACQFCTFACELTRVEALDQRQGSSFRDEEGVPVAAVAAALSAMRLPISGATVASVLSAYVGAAGDAAGAKKAAVAEKVRQRRAQQQSQKLQDQQATAAVPADAEVELPPPLPVDPLATAFWRLRVCGNPGCEELGGASEAELDLRLCGRCRSVRYCCAGCQAAHWAAGHREACGRVARACAASAGGH